MSERTLESMKAAAERFANRLEYRRQPTTPEQQQKTIDHWEKVFSEPQKPDGLRVICRTAKECDYNKARAVFIEVMEKRADEIAVITANPNFKWVWSKEQGAVIKILIQWLINDPDCPISLSKGPFVYGLPGTGKTEITQALAKTSERLELTKQFKYTSMSAEYVRAKNDSGYDAVAPNIQANRCLDEFGRHTGDTIQWGNKTDLNESIIEERYTRFMRYGQITIIISNGDTKEVSGLFTPMVSDRLRAMCTGVMMPGDSKR